MTPPGKFFASHTERDLEIMDRAEKAARATTRLSSRGSWFVGEGDEIAVDLDDEPDDSEEGLLRATMRVELRELHRFHEVMQVRGGWTLAALDDATVECMHCGRRVSFGIQRRVLAGSDVGSMRCVWCTGLLWPLGNWAAAWTAFKLGCSWADFQALLRWPPMEGT